MRSILQLILSRQRSCSYVEVLSVITYQYVYLLTVYEYEIARSFLLYQVTETLIAQSGPLSKQDAFFDI